MPPSKRRHPPRQGSAPPPRAPLQPLGAIVREYETWRRAQAAGKPAKGASREYWKQRDAQQGQRPDYLLWRQTLGGESPLEKRQDAVALAVRALREPEPMIHWAGLALAPVLLEDKAALNPARREELIKAMLGRLGPLHRPLPMLPACPQSSVLMAWIARALVTENANAPELLKELRELLTASKADWKPGRAADVGFLKTEAWLPVPRGVIIRWLVKGITAQLAQAEVIDLPNQKVSSQDAVAWHLTAWMLLRDARPPQSAARADELSVLLDAAGAARIAGDAFEAARLTALALNLASPQMPEAFLQRCRVAAWALAEAGLTAPAGLRVRLDDLPFPGDPPASEKGLEAARLFHDADDVSRHAMAIEMVDDADWQRLRVAGIALHHPLAALAWIGKKAQSYVVKKQQDLLQSAATLAARHYAIGTTGRILSQWPGSAEAVLAFAQTMRQSQRRMPLLRDSEVWQDWAADLRAAWGRLDADAIHEPEAIFMLHETLLDREVTALRCLPEDLRLLALRHFHSRRSPSALVQALEAEPKMMQALSHQRTLELWALAAEMRERPEQGSTAWISLVARGDAASGKYSLLVQGPAGRMQSQGRLRASTTAAEGVDPAPLVKEIAEAVTKVCASPEWVLLAVDATWHDQSWPELLHQAGLTASVAFIPSWEWAFRTLREGPAPAGKVEFEVLLPEGGPTPGALPESSGAAFAQACVLLPGQTTSDANTRWNVMGHQAAASGETERPRSRRSLSIGGHPCVISLSPLQRGGLSADLTRLSLAQATLCMIAFSGNSGGEHSAWLEALMNPPPRCLFADHLRSMMKGQAGAWRISGLPWLLAPEALKGGQ